MSRIKPSVYAALLFALAVSGCFPFEYYTRGPALVEGIDIRQSIQVATDQMHRGGIEQALSIWALRDQFVTPEQAKEIGDLYLANIDGMEDEFNVWHTSWAIANLYKWGDQAVKASLETAFQRATRQPELLTGWMKNSANNHINGDKITAGFIHAGGAYYAHRFLVVPGNEDFLQSYEEYRKEEKK